MKCLWRSARQIEFQRILLYLVCRLVVFCMFDGLQVFYIQAGAPCLCVWWAMAKLTSSLINFYEEWNCSNRKQRQEGTRHIMFFNLASYIMVKIFHPSWGLVWYPCLWYPLSWAVERCFGGEKWLLSFFCIVWICTWVHKNNCQSF